MAPYPAHTRSHPRAPISDSDEYYGAKEIWRKELRAPDGGGRDRNGGEQTLINITWSGKALPSKGMQLSLKGSTSQCCHIWD